jgi:hypothetical protein
LNINVPSLFRKVRDREASTKSQGLAAVDVVEAARLLGGQPFVHPQFKLTHYPLPNNVDGRGATRYKASGMAHSFRAALYV